MISLSVFRSVASPPFLLGAGMLSASIMALTYYSDWEMDRMLPESVLILGGGTLFFTFSCILLNKVFPSTVKFRSKQSWNSSFNVSFLHKFYLASICIGVLGILLKVFFLRGHFGELSLSALIMAKRMDDWNGTNEFLLPSWVRQMGSYTLVLSVFTIWLLCLIVTKQSFELLKIKKLLYVHLAVVFFDGMLSGSKAPMLNMALQFGLFYIFAYYSNNRSFFIERKIWIRTIFVLLLLSLSFRGLSLMIGRSVEDTSNTDLLAEYCGAEIKNFDLFMHSSIRVKPQRWGDNTFRSLYTEINPNLVYSNGEFQSVKNFDLGNVYTMYKPFYEDFGIEGVFGMCFFIAFISMFIYSKTKKSLYMNENLNVYLLIYSTIILPLFMGFFSSKFTESVCRLGWLRSCVYLFILCFYLKRHIYIKKY